MRVLVDAADFEALAESYFARAAAARVRHAEVFFDPQAHVARGVGHEVVAEGFAAAAREARERWGITSVLVPCLLRHLPVEDGEGWFNGALAGGYFTSQGGKEGEQPRFGGLGLCSSEVGRPPSLWRAVFARARKAGVRVTAHAGEEGPAAYVAGALDELGVRRIDHGVNSAQSDEVMARLAREGVMLTVCPLSNVQLKCVRGLGELPIKVFLEKGVRFSINSDDPAYFGGFIQENYCQVQDTFGLSVDEWALIARNAIEGSWCDAHRKEELAAELEEVLGQWEKRGALDNKS